MEDGTARRGRGGRGRGRGGGRGRGRVHNSNGRGAPDDEQQLSNNNNLDQEDALKGAEAPKRRKPRKPRNRGGRTGTRNNKPGADMTVLVHRINLVDGWNTGGARVNREYPQLPTSVIHADAIVVNPYSFEEPGTESSESPQTDNPAETTGNGESFFDSFGGQEAAASEETKNSHNHRIVIAHAPISTEHGKLSSAMVALNDAVLDKQNPHVAGDLVVHDKYWAQRKRLFSRFDDGIQLDSQGWYSVTPEAIADHVARRMGEAASLLAEQQEPSQGGGFFGCAGITILDAFCGCGGNAIAFGKLSPFSVSKVVCCDTDIVKLRYAAHNASIYGIPCDKLVFVLCNSLYVMDRCYRNGKLVQEAVACMPITSNEDYQGFIIGGLDLLPPAIDAIFMDPPWGGVDYNQVGKNGYDLAKHIHLKYNAEKVIEGVGDAQDEDFPSVDGEKLLAIAARAIKSKFIVYDVPRNTNKQSLARAALAAGYRGNIKVEEHYLNGRLKTTTAYMGWDYSLEGHMFASRS